MYMNLWSNTISIHAPPRGATAIQEMIFGNKLISIHAPPRGATDYVIRDGIMLAISIHAPPRGATADCVFRVFKKIFQFTPLREGRRQSGEKHHRRHHFNSRPSARGDIAAEATTVRPYYFNSRPSARGDKTLLHG